MSGPTRLTMLQVSRLLNTPIGILRRDPAFPEMLGGTFDESAVIAWKAARDAKPASPADTTPTEK